MLQFGRYWALGAILFLSNFPSWTSQIEYDDLSIRLNSGLRPRRGEIVDRRHASNVNVKQLKHRSLRSVTDNRTSDINRTINTGHFMPLKQQPTSLPQLKTLNAKSERTIPLPMLSTDLLVRITSSPLQLNCGNKVLSCSGKCKENVTHGIFSFKDIKGKSSSYCYCDKACNDIFHDCCSDYKMACSIPSKPKSIDEFYQRQGNWKCISMKSSTSGCFASWGTWMVARCPDSWSDDGVKSNCHNPASKLDAHSLYLYLPVVGLPDLLTYRNKYCALCNNVSTYEFWTLIFNKDAIPPPYYTPDSFLAFIANNYQYQVSIRPKEGQRIRWCKYSNVISTCPKTTAEQGVNDCLQGTAGLVEASRKIFKNKACARCNGYSLVCGVSQGDARHCAIDSSAISRAISLADYGVSMEIKSCRKNEVYDTILGKCRQTYVIKHLSVGSADEYEVTMSVLIKTKTLPSVNSFKLETALSDYLKVNKSRIGNIKVDSTMTEEAVEMLFIFRIQLTKTQSLLLAMDEKLNKSSNEAITLRRLFEFKEAFQLNFSDQFYKIYRQKIRQVTCIRPHVYHHGQYIFLDSLKIRILSSGAIYEQFEYYMNSSAKNASVTVCLKISRPVCNGSYIRLNSSEYYFTDNLTLVYSFHGYRLGEYLYEKGMAYVCVNYGKEYTAIIKNKTSKDDLALVILTWIGFILSIIGLLVLFFTYIIFKELRSLPGKNLMNLSISLCIADLLWLVGSTLDDHPTACTVVAIANHYFFLAFFVASSVIAFHSCLIFGRKVVLLRSASEDNKIFLVYMLLVWGTPAVFLLTFGLLDRNGLFVIDYGKSAVCWLGTNEAKIFLFIVPFGTLLFFNLCLFIIVALSLRHKLKSSDKTLGNETREREKQNIKICLKLSTLMGFSWLSGLLQVAIETETDVFAYLFIIFVSFQALFICAAFLFQRKCYNLYSKLVFHSPKATGTGADTPSSMRKSNTRDTKL